MGTEAVEPGLDGTAELEVTAAVTAERVGSGDVPVLGTPEVVAVVERAAVAALAGRLPDGQTSVGTRIEMDHLAPTPVGGRVTARARLGAVDGRRLTFSFEASDEDGVVARGVHHRALVNRDGFLGSANARRGGRSAAES